MNIQMKTNTLALLIVPGTLTSLHAQKSALAEIPGHPTITYDESTPATRQEQLTDPVVRVYSLRFVSEGGTAEEREKGQGHVLDLIIQALDMAVPAKHKPVSSEADSTVEDHKKASLDNAPWVEGLAHHWDTGVLIAQVTEAQHATIADIVRVLKEVQPDRPPGKAEATTEQVVRIHGIKAILGPNPREDDEAGKNIRAAHWDSLMSLIDTALVMAGCEQPRPALGLHDESNCLVVGGTAEQIDLISHAISACHENERPGSPSVMPVRVIRQQTSSPLLP